MQSSKFIVFSGFILVIFFGYADFKIGYAISFSLFYLIPIILVTWYSGLSSGICISLCSALAWFFADTWAHSEYPHVLVPYWNAFVRLGFFLIIAILLAKLRIILEREKRLARKDNLTDSWNRLAFYELAKIENARAIRYNHAITLIYIDLDNFKKVNDRFGHAEGDALLILVVRIISKRIRISDILARLGGDEFALLLPQIDGDAAMNLIEHIRRELLQAMKEKDWPVTFSIGMITFLKPQVAVEEMLCKTDELMYHIKRNHKNDIIHKIYH